MSTALDPFALGKTVASASFVAGATTVKDTLAFIYPYAVDTPPSEFEDHGELRTDIAPRLALTLTPQGFLSPLSAVILPNEPINIATQRILKQLTGFELTATEMAAALSQFSSKFKYASGDELSTIAISLKLSYARLCEMRKSASMPSVVLDTEHSGIVFAYMSKLPSDDPTTKEMGAHLLLQQKFPGNVAVELANIMTSVIARDRADYCRKYMNSLKKQ